MSGQGQTPQLGFRMTGKEAAIVIGAGRSSQNERAKLGGTANRSGQAQGQGSSGTSGSTGTGSAGVCALSLYLYLSLGSDRCAHLGDMVITDWHGRAPAPAPAPARRLKAP